jgi:hypothetical protein
LKTDRISSKKKGVRRFKSPGVHRSGLH